MSLEKLKKGASFRQEMLTLPEYSTSSPLETCLCFSYFDSSHVLSMDFGVLSAILLSFVSFTIDKTQ